MSRVAPIQGWNRLRLVSARVLADGRIVGLDGAVLGRLRSGLSGASGDAGGTAAADGGLDASIQTPLRTVDASPGLPTVVVRDGDGDGCWYLVYYWEDNGEVFHVMLLSCGGGGGSEDEPECTEDQEAIAAEYDADGEWPCDKFDDAVTHGDGTHGHDTGFLASSYKSGRSAVWSYMATNHGVSGWIDSDWRCPDGNAAVDGAGGSQHVQGLAGDFDATGFDEAMHDDFEEAASAAGAGWWSPYGSNGYTGHIHIDWR